jgi:hypothetical protein
VAQVMAASTDVAKGPRMLSGELTDFSLADVLRLLSTTHKSGVLTLHDSGSDACVFVRHGDICLALIDVTRVPFGPRMIMKNIADPETIAAATRTADGTVFGLACALMHGVSDPEAASRLAADDTRETVGWLSQYSTATFNFDPTIAVDAWPFEPLPAEQVLTDIERGAQQWAELREVVGHLSQIPSCVPEPPDAAAFTLTAPQWRIVALVDGQRTIKDLVEVVGLGLLDTGRELAGLVREGLVELVEPGGHSAVEALLRDVPTVDGFSTSPEWMAHDDDLPAHAVSGEPVGAVDGDAGDAVEIPWGPVAQPTEPRQEATPAFREGDDLSVADEHAAPSDVESDANLGLLNRLVGRNRTL